MLFRHNISSSRQANLVDWYGVGRWTWSVCVNFNLGWRWVLVNSYATAERVNSDVNSQVQYKTDFDQYDTPDYWIEAGTIGDCEDYALLKRQVLLKSGFNNKDIHLACCWVETGGYHCVLLVGTDKGWFVLDNRHQFPMIPKSLPYKWDKALREDGKWYELSF